MTSPRRKHFRLSIERLEARIVNSVANIGLSSGLLKIEANDRSTDVVVNKVGTSVVVTDNSPTSGFIFTAPTWKYATSRVSRIEFHGGDAADTFVNNYSVPTTAWGNEGNDYLEGANADDRLFGGPGADTLKGYGGNDSLYGGGTASTSNDILWGGSGKDRFLTQKGDVIKDGKGINSRTGEDAELHFVNGGTSTWTNKEIETIDSAFQQLFDATGNNRLLKDSGTDNVLTFTKEDLPLSPEGNRILATNTDPWQHNEVWYTGPWWNRTEHRNLRTEPRKIVIDDWNANSSSENAQMIDTIIHEIGHNWDSVGEGNSRFTAFSNLSGWKSSNPAGSTHYRSGDGDWYYAKTAKDGFFGSVVNTGRGNNLRYGKWNPREDFATAWEHYFDNGRSTYDSDSIRSAKLRNIDQLIRTLS
jgi:hypothetical protein